MSHHRLIIPDPDAPPITRATVRRVIRTFRPYRRTVGLVGALILITSAIGVINPLLIKVIFDQALFCGPGCPNLDLLYWLVGLMVAIPIGSGVIGIWQSYLANVVIVISTVVAMLILSWQLTLLSLGTMPFFFWLMYKVGKARREVAANTQKSLADLSAITEETLSVSGMLLSKAFGRQRYETDRFRRENERLAGLQVRQQMIGRSFFATIQIFFSVTPALVYLVAGIVLSGGGAELTAGDIVAFTTLQSRLFFPVGSMLQIGVEVQSAMALFDRVFEYLDMPHEITDGPDAVPLPREQANGLVRFRDVSFRYEAPREDTVTEDGEAEAISAAVPVSPDAPDGDGQQRRLWTLEDVDFEIEPGTLAALVGPSGAGKTTVTYLVPRFYDVQKGAVEIDGTDVRKIKLASLGDIIGMVTQETYLFHTSVRENLRYGNPDATDDQLEAAARAAFIHQRIAELPDGYDTLVGERGYKLSGGEKQRLAIARVILKDPGGLIPDEATSSLDTTSERLVQEALRPLMRGRTTIAIAHRLSTILSADVIFVLDRGRVVERGTHAELLEWGGLYARLYEQQFRGGAVEAECEDGVVLASGEVVSREAAG